MNLKQEISKSFWTRFKNRIKANPKLYPIALAIKRSLFSLWMLLYAPHRKLFIYRYLRNSKVPKLHLGAQYAVIPGWLNTDLMPMKSGIQYLDASKKFPFDDETFDYVFSEHLIEHLTCREGSAMVRECFRVLKKGGRLRLATPDLRKWISLLNDPLEKDPEDYIRWYAEKFMEEGDGVSGICVLNHNIRNWGHQFLYDERTLRELLLNAGFGNIQRFLPGQSDLQDLKGIEKHGVLTGNESANQFETLVVEALKS